MLFIEDLRDISVLGNMDVLLRDRRGRVVDKREGHNVFTNTGRNLLSKLIVWQTVGGPDVPYTNRRVRWAGVGSGSQLEVSSVSRLSQPVLANPTDYIVPVQTIEFPSSTSVRVIKEFATSEINITGAPVAITEAGMFADVEPANMGGTEDSGHTVATDPTLNPQVSANPPIVYKTFEPLTKTVDFTLEIRWEFRF